MKNTGLKLNQMVRVVGLYDPLSSQEESEDASERDGVDRSPLLNDLKAAKILVNWNKWLTTLPSQLF
jgi:hypothetical protein